MRSILEQAREDGYQEGLSHAFQVGSDEEWARGYQQGLVDGITPRFALLLLFLFGLALGGLL